MKNKIKDIVRFAVKRIVLLLKGIFLNILSVLSVLVQADLFCNDLKKIKIDKSKECVVIGCGPSLSETIKSNIDFFAGKTVVCVNDFALFEYFSTIKPDFYILFDTVYWVKDLSGHLRNSNEQIFRSLKGVFWPMTIIMPLGAKEWNWFMDLPGLNKNIKICYVNWTRVECFKSLKYFLYSNNLAMPRSINVLIHAVFLAVNMGCKKIFLVGADHSWHENIFLNKDNVVYFKSGHFYPEEESSLIPVFKDPDEIEVFKMHELFHAFALTFEGHQEVADYAKFKGAKVYNASKKSYIDAYERVLL